MPTARHPGEVIILRERRQEKIAWIAGWLGGFGWLLVLSAILLFRGIWLPALVGLLIGAAAWAAILFFAPWKHPRTRYRELLAPIYVILLGAVIWGVWAFGARQVGISSWWQLLLLIPTLAPLWTVGSARWEDHDTRHDPTKGAVRRP
jgi:hypothetical protein